MAKERIAVSAEVAKKRIAGKDVVFEVRAEKLMAERRKDWKLGDAKRISPFTGAR